jgi:glycine dehydrogenase subunit 1
MLFEFQTQVAAKITGMDVANASLYDGSTGTAEAVLMARIASPGKNKVILSGGLHPHYTPRRRDACLNGRTGPRVSLKPDVQRARATCSSQIDGSTAAVVLQTPDFYRPPARYPADRR